MAVLTPTPSVGTPVSAPTTSQANSATPITAIPSVGQSTNPTGASGDTNPTATVTPTPANSGSTPIVASSLGTITTPVTVPTYTAPTPTPAVDPNSAAAGLQALADKANADSQDGPVTTQVNTISQQLAALLPQDEGKSQALAEADTAAGVDTLTSQLNDINNQITAEQANQNQSDTQLVANSRNLENTDTLLPFVQEGQAKLAGDAAILRGLSTAKIGVLNARATALQGNITLAQAQAQKAVDAKYAPIEDQINTYQAQINALTPQMNEEQQQQAEARTQANNLALQKIQTQADQEKANLAIALQSGASTKFVNNNGTFFNTATGEQYATPADFFKAAGVTSFEDAYQKGLITDYTPQMADDYNTVQQLASKYPDAGISATDSPEQAVAKLDNSAIYRKETYIAPSSADTSGQLADSVNQSLSNIKQGFATQKQIGSNGTVNSTAYRGARNTFVNQYSGYIANPGQEFDDAFSSLIDQNGTNYKKDYGIGDN